MFWLGTIAVTLYALAGIAIGIVFTITKHWQLIFLALMTLTLLIPMAMITVPWRKRTAEKSLKFTVFFLIIPLFFCCLSLFLSLNYKGDRCLKCKKAEEFCIPETWACGKTDVDKVISDPTQPTYVLGKVSHSREEFLKHISNLSLYTFRKGFFPTSKGFSSDSGFGCILRSGQMLLSEVYQRLYLGADFVQNAQLYLHCPRCVWLSSLFSDEAAPDTRSQHPFSIQHFIEIGEVIGCAQGSWMGPGAMAHIVQSAVHATSGMPVPLRVYVSEQGLHTVYLPDAKKLMHSSPPPSRSPSSLPLIPPPFPSCYNSPCTCETSPIPGSSDSPQLNKLAQPPSSPISSKECSDDSASSYSTPSPAHTPLSRQCPSTPDISDLSSVQQSNIRSTPIPPDSYFPDTPHSPESPTVPLLILIPTRLGLQSIHNLYYAPIASLFTLPMFCGMVAGHPHQAHYFFGSHPRTPLGKSLTNSQPSNHYLLYLDPHKTKPTEPVDYEQWAIDEQRFIDIQHINRKDREENVLSTSDSEHSSEHPEMRRHSFTNTPASSRPNASPYEVSPNLLPSEFVLKQTSPVQMPRPKRHISRNSETNTDSRSVLKRKTHTTRRDAEREIDSDSANSLPFVPHDTSKTHHSHSSPPEPSRISPSSHNSSHIDRGTPPLPPGSTAALSTRQITLSHIRAVNISTIDPSVCFAFLVADEHELNELAEQVSIIFSKFHSTTGVNESVGPFINFDQKSMKERMQAVEDMTDFDWDE
ncbi:Cysteine protease ATG4C [Blattamonas nauphoetae]|uniref:Cysteine protease n=1 Tax=Blattamonas nauphoetae TaxID=2049346 RepID=A0ABQ9X8Z0_9EUKA|nr:Cysteine protease ATG4C [Blattamonas nauphoetae]